MRNVMNSLYIIILAALAIYTGEIVTFLMLGFVLIALNNINRTLKKIAHTSETK